MVKEGLIASLILLLCSILCCFTTLTQPYIAYSEAIFDAATKYAAREVSYEEYVTLSEEAYADYAATILTPEDTVKNYVSLISNYVCSFGIPFACALLSIKLYRKKIKGDILHIRTQCNDMYTYRNKLVTRGGTSPALAIIGALIVVIAALIRTTLPMFLAMIK